MQEMSHPRGITHLEARHYAIIVLVIATALLHIAVSMDAAVIGHPPPDPLFLLNGLGYLGLLGAYFLPIPFFQERHKLVWWALFIYIIVTIVAWVVIWVGLNVLLGGKNFFDRDTLYGGPSKIIEIILLFLLWRDKP